MTTLLDAPGDTLSRHRRAIVVVLIVLAVLVGVAVLTRDQTKYEGLLDPRNPQADGAQAVARVLKRHGVEVDVVRHQADLLDHPIGAGDSVVVTGTTALGPSTVRGLARHADAAGALVYVGAADVLAELDGPAASEDSSSGSRQTIRADCEEPLVRDLTLRSGAQTGFEADGCFDGDVGSLLVHRDRTWHLAALDVLTNEHVLDRDNAALALRLLGQRPHLVWYVADPRDLLASDGVSIGPFLPRWLAPGLGLMLPVVLAVMLWRGRRLGPLVTEPLPVVIRAVEATQSRGRLYRRTGDREHAVAILVEATRHRLVDALGLPPGADAATVAAAAAARSGRDPHDVHLLLTTTTVPTNARLADLGRRLIDLENEVRGP